ncbi:MAG: hypothetical protein WCV62_05720 [Candidatus Peribacteraceae bacterium]|jgi:hypothetical protein
MKITLDTFGGIIPRILDPVLIPPNRSQVATNCEFGSGGITPLDTDLLDSVPAKTLAESLYEYYNLGSRYSFTWNTDVDAVRAPHLSDSYNRVYYTESGVFKVTDKNLFNQAGTDYPMASRIPSPLAPTITPIATGTASGADPTLLETRGYVYTLVNGYGQEGPPSAVSNLKDLYDGDLCTITGMDVTAATDYWITAKRIYRINQGTSGAEYQFVVEIAIATSSYADTVLDADLGEVLASTEWDGPPAGISGLVSLPNGVLAGFVDNLVCFSVPYYPHAWPASYQKAVDRDIVALGAYGTTVVVLTEGQPYLVIGNDPSNTVMERMDLGFSCLSKQGKVQAGEVVIYPCAEGLAAVGPGASGIVTEEVIGQDEWLANYSPSTIHAYYWQGKYVGFYGSTSGFIFDLKSKNLVDLDFYATAGFYDKTDGTLYLLVSGEIVKFTAGGSSREINYLSKKYRFLPTCFGWVKVVAKTYPVKVDVIYRDIPYTIPKTVTSDEPVRLETFLVDTCEIRVLGTEGVSAILLTSTLEEMAL